MKINYQGHSAVYIETRAGHKILMDPFLSGNPNATLDPDTVEVDYIILTHGHDDHVGDTVSIAKRTGAKIIAPVELAEYLEQEGLEAHGMNLGGDFQFPFGKVKYVQAFHSSATMKDGVNIYLGPAAGVLLTADDKTVYHLGDTALFGDMKLIGELHNIDLALVPIGSNFTMGPDDAAVATHMIKPKLAIPIHYNTFPVIEQDPKKYLDKLNEIEGMVPTPGDWIVV